MDVGNELLTNLVLVDFLEELVLDEVLVGVLGGVRHEVVDVAASDVV